MVLLTVAIRSYKLSAMRDKVPSDVCAQQRLKLACASAQSNPSLRCQQEEILRSGDMLIRLHERIG